MINIENKVKTETNLDFIKGLGEGTLYFPRSVVRGIIAEEVCFNDAVSSQRENGRSVGTLVGSILYSGALATLSWALGDFGEYSFF